MAGVMDRCDRPRECPFLALLHYRVARQGIARRDLRRRSDERSPRPCRRRDALPRRPMAPIGARMLGEDKHALADLPNRRGRREARRGEERPAARSGARSDRRWCPGETLCGRLATTADDRARNARDTGNRACPQGRRRRAGPPPSRAGRETHALDFRRRCRRPTRIGIARTSGSRTHRRVANFQTGGQER